MTSKAERLRKKRAARRLPGTVTVAPEQVAMPKPRAALATREVIKPRPVSHDALRHAEITKWFDDLYIGRERGDPSATTQLAEVKKQLTPPEFAVLCEYSRRAGKGDVAYRVGRSQITVSELWASALRKLVMYRAWSDDAQA